MRGVNKVVLVGTLGANPESKSFPNGGSICNFSIATTEKWQSKQTGEWIEQTEWHRIVAWAKLAEICGEYLHKGSRVYIEGKLQTRKWQDQGGADRYTTEIIAREMKMLTPRGSGGEEYGGESYGQGGGSSYRGTPPIGDDVPF